MKKHCNKCNKNRELKFFSKRIVNGVNVGRSNCKKCDSILRKTYYKNNKNEVSSKNKNWYERNKEKRLKQCREYSEKNKIWRNKKARKAYKKNKHKKREYRQVNKIIIRESNRNYRHKNREKVRKANRNWRQKNSIKLRQQYRNKRKNDFLFRLNENIRGLIRQSFKQNNNRKTSKTTDILGCSIKYFKEYLEIQFEPWMNWGNYGKYVVNGERTWNIDHKIPTSSVKTSKELLQLNHYKNLRPFDSKENLLKYNKIYPEFLNNIG